MKYLFFCTAILFSFLLTIQKAFSQKQGQQLVDSLLLELPGAKEDSNKVLLLKQLSFKYANINPAEGIKFGKKALELSKKIQWEKGKAWSYNSIGINYFTQADYEKTMHYYQKSLKINEAINHYLGLAVNYRNIGIIYGQWADYQRALESYNRSLKLYRALNDKNGEAAILCNTGNVYTSNEDYEVALTYFKKALKICEEVNDKKDCALNLSNMAFSYKKLGKYDMSLEYSSRSLKINEAIGDRLGMTLCFINIGSVYLEQKKYAKAIEVLSEGLKIAESMDAKDREGEILGKIGTCYLGLAQKSTKTNQPKEFTNSGKTENLNKAFAYLNRSIALCKAINDIDDLEQYTKVIADAYALCGNYKDALECYKICYAFKDSYNLSHRKNWITNIARK